MPDNYDDLAADKRTVQQNVRTIPRYHDRVVTYTKVTATNLTEEPRKRSSFRPLRSHTIQLTEWPNS